MRMLVALAAIVAPQLAQADDEIVRGAVVKIEAQEIYVSIGVARGVGGGDSVRIKRAVSLKHPVTRATVQDWIPIGSASVTQAGASMSRAVIGDMVSAVKVGDIAEILVERGGPATPQPTTPTPQPPPPQGPPIEPATAEVLGVFAAQVGQPLDVRIAAWERYLSMRAGSPFAAAIRRDLDQLHTLRDELMPRTSAQQADAIVTVGHNAPSQATAGEQLPVVFVLEQPERVASAYLHYRPRGNRTYRSVLLAREHDIYLRGTLPAEVVTAPGLDYFVEVSTPQGRSGLALGTPLTPVAIEVAKPTILEQFGSKPGRSSVKMSGDYLDFATFDRRTGDHTDRMFAGNVDFTYSLDSVVESLGVGYGVYVGRGGYTNLIWTEDSPPEKSGFHYGYADMELGGNFEGVHVGMGGQVIAGVGRDGFGLGGEARLRVGARDSTNLALIGRTISEVGFLSDIRFGTRLHELVMLGVSVGATDQPNRGDVAVKLGTELEIAALSKFSVLLRGSWQGRSTRHGGLGAGAGLGVYW